MQIFFFFLDTSVIIIIIIWDFFLQKQTLKSWNFFFLHKQASHDQCEVVWRVCTLEVVKSSGL